MHYQSSRIGKFGKLFVKFQAMVVAISMVAMFPISANAVTLVDEGGNPTLGESCGLDIALVMDTSGSIDNDELSDMKDALQGFVSALSATPSLFAVVQFDDSASTVTGFTDAATAGTALAGVNGDGATNWEAALEQADGEFDPRVGSANLIIFASDGNPTVNNGSSATPGNTDGNDLINAVTVADGIKAGGTRIVTIGIGNGVSQSNLEDISSADAYYDAATFAAFDDTLQEIVVELCGGTLNISKVIDADGNLDTTEDQTSGGAGWTFTVTGEGNLVTLETGNITIDADAGAYAVTEIQNDGYSFVGAHCVNQDQETQGSPANMTIGAIQVDDDEVVSCTFYNTPIVVPEDSATVYADKVVCVDEQYLPNWHNAEITIGASTAEDYVLQVNTENQEEVCWLSEWEFQWTPDVAEVDENPGDNVEEAGDPWTSFTSSAVIPNPDGGTFWFREVIPSGWLPFSGTTEEPHDNVSAEFYCGSDVLNYDNFDFISGLEDGDVEYCVGFNVDTTPEEDPICDNGLDDDQDGLADEEDPGCYDDSGEYNPEDEDETNYECSDNVDNADSEDELADELDPGCHTDGDPNDEDESYDPFDDDESNDSGSSSEEDVCPNLQGNQSSLPDGYHLDDEGECEKGGGGGGGGGRRRAPDTGEVLGAASCTVLLTQYLHKDWNNSTDEVTKLQNFLNQFITANIGVTGIFDLATFDAVKKFQMQYGSDVLIPWVGLPASGISGEDTPTGFVYQTTRWKINNLWCPGSEAFPAVLN